MKKVAPATIVLLAGITLSGSLVAAADDSINPVPTDSMFNVDTPHVSGQGDLHRSERVDDTPAANIRGAVADSVREAKDPNFAGLIVDEPSNSVSVYLTHAAGPGVRSAVALGKSKGAKVHVIENARFNRGRLLKAARELADNGPLVQKYGISAVSVMPDGSGLEVMFTGDSPSPSGISELGNSVGIGESIVATPRAGAATTQAARQADAAAYSGGARLKFAGGLCTSGFSVIHNGVGKLATAQHCDPTNADVVTNGAGVKISAGSAGIASIDSKLVDPIASPATGPYVYTGTYGSSTKTLVKNWSSNNVGEAICISGATSGGRCGVIDRDATALPAGGPSGTFYIRAKANSGWLSAGGDSGGPWIRSVTGGVQARGIHYGGIVEVPCGAIEATAVSYGVTCTQYSFYTPISVVLNSWGATLEVG